MHPLPPTRRATWRAIVRASAVASCTLATACGGPAKKPAADGSAAQPPDPATSGFIDLFPHVRVDRAARAVEFDAHITPMMHFANQPVMWLEVLVTTSDAKPHETLLVSDAKGEHIHAALLIAGARPGAPGVVRVDAVGQTHRQPPTGDAVRIAFEYADPLTGEHRTADPREWVKNMQSGEMLAGGSFLFAGSEVREFAGERVYMADSEGTIIGLTTFGTEMIAFSTPVSHAETIDAPVWQADMAKIPPNRHPVTVRIDLDQR